MNDPSNHPLSDDELAAIAAAVAAHLDTRRKVDEETHHRHHEFIAAQIERDEKRGEMYDKIKAHVIGWAVVGLITGIGYAVIDWARKIMHQAPPG